MKKKDGQAAGASADVEPVLEKLNKLRVWKKRGQVAPHKPLLMLYAFGQFSQGKEALPYSDVDAPLQKLLREFGLGQGRGTEHPFWRLQRDGLWEVTADEPFLPRTGSVSGVNRSELINKNAVGAFPEEVKQVLRDSQNLKIVVTALLEKSFPETYHQDILDAVGLSLETGPDRKKRSAKFRPNVLRAYESRCCVCGYDARIGNIPAGVEAAHIMWHQAGGPDTVPNGLALCTLHHKIFDLGAFTVDADGLRLIFSQDLSGTMQIDWLLGFHGKPMRRPQSETYLPNREFLDWHRSRVFKSPQRDLPGRIKA